MMKNSILTITLIISIFVFMAENANSQKVPKIQNQSARPPANLKIDGKLDDWGGSFRAYNLANNIYYSLANDKENLYVVVQTSNALATQKIFRGGISITFAPALKNKSNAILTYPALSKKVSPEMEKLQDSYYLFKALSVDTIGNKNRIDSLVSTVNNQIEHLFKVFHFVDVKKNADNVISIYNDKGILARCGVDSKMRFCYELAVPIKYVEPYVNNQNMMTYNIKLNARPTLQEEGFKSFAPPLLTVTTNSDPDALFLLYQTDLTGEYPLAK